MVNEECELAEIILIPVLNTILNKNIRMLKCIKHIFSQFEVIAQIILLREVTVLKYF